MPGVRWPEFVPALTGSAQNGDCLDLDIQARFGEGADLDQGVGGILALEVLGEEFRLPIRVIVPIGNAGDKAGDLCDVARGATLCPDDAKPPA